VLDAHTAPVCGSQSCRWKYLSVPKHQACAICGRPLSVRELAAGICASPECQRRWFVDRKRQQREALEEEGRELRRRGAEVLGIDEPPEAFPLAIIPSTTLEVAELPEHRRRAFRDRLASIIAEAAERRAAGEPVEGDAAAEEWPQPPSPDLSAVLGGACATCKGYCCRSGGDRAWLTVGTMQRYMDAHPGVGPGDVLEAYAAHVRAETVRDSCVYHQPDGCSLPRDLRSDICNRYFCDGLQGFRRDLSDEDPVRGFFAAVEDGEVRAGAFVDARATRVVPAV
jgi:hypothetical protein